MKNYLFTWNPEKWPWKDLALRSHESAAGKIVFEPWSCSANYTKIKKGDRAFLVKLGRMKPNGIIASGWVKSDPKSDLHWNPEKAALGERTFFTDCEWERLLDPEIDEPLLLAELKKGKLASMHWTPQSSGVRISDEIIDELEAKWAAHVGRTPLAIVAIDAELAAIEGAERLSLVRHRKREHTLREAKINEARKLGRGRLKCEVPGCGFDFEAVYGELGQAYAQVHHLKPLGDRATLSETKLSDLAVVCANCHAMVHRNGKCRPLDKLIP